MGKTGKRKQSLTSNSSHTITTNSQDIDDDSGFCGSNLSPTVNKMVRFDEEMLLLKELMKEVNEPLIDSSIRNINNTNKMVNYQSKSKNGKFELKILSQPEEQHRFDSILHLFLFLISINLIIFKNTIIFVFDFIVLIELSLILIYFLVLLIDC